MKKIIEKQRNPLKPEACFMKRSVNSFKPLPKLTEKATQQATAD